MALNASAFADSGRGEHPFGIDAENAASALRDLAARIEAGEVHVASVRVQGLSSTDTFTSTLLRLKLHEQRAPKG